MILLMNISNKNNYCIYFAKRTLSIYYANKLRKMNLNVYCLFPCYFFSLSIIYLNKQLETFYKILGLNVITGEYINLSISVEFSFQFYVYTL